MARTNIPLQSNPAIQGSGPIPIDTSNGMHVDLSGNAIAALLDRYQLHVVINNTAGAGSVVVKGGFGPWAVGMGQGDLTIAVGATSVVDLNGSIVLARHSRDSFGSFDLDFVTVAGTIMVVLGNVALVPGNSPQNVIIKHLPGYLLAAVVTTVGTAALSHYDHQGAAAGTAIHTIAGSAALGSMYVPGAKTLNGITAQSVASGPAVSVFYT